MIVSSFLGLNKECQNKDMNSNQEYRNRQKELKDVINHRTSSKTLCGSSNPINKNNTYMSNHIKRMLNASLNNSNPSISSHRNRCKVPATKQIKDLNFGSKGSSKRSHGESKNNRFNNTQKINIGNHLE